MKVSLSWLKDYVSIETNVNDLSDRLTMAGLEVETVEDRYAYLDTVVVGQVKTVAPHPNADRLKCCQVDIGERMVNVVCGAPNVKKDMHSALALPNTLLPDGFLLEKSIIRGEVSEGMLCSEGELGTGDDRSGIMTLDAPVSPGEKIAKVMGLSDAVLDISITPNRPDCLSILGIAREVAALYQTPLKYPDFTITDACQDIPNHTSVIIESPDHCPRYVARLLENITIAPSPFWLRDRLMSVGLRPINNIVDITNFILMETGQPLHAFDFDRLAQNRIVVRTAKSGEMFTTLDEKERTMASDMLMICDGEKPVAVAGVMGGVNSEIEDTTTRVLLESAYFNPISIRRTSKRLGLSTEASYRFERGIDPDGSVKAANRAARLMAELGSGRLIAGLIDEHPEKSAPKKISLSVQAANNLLSTRLNRDEMADMLGSVEFTVEKSDDEDVLTAIPPTFRVDVSRPEDLMEEIARISGYDNIPTTVPVLPTTAQVLSKSLILREQVKEIMTGFGFTEAVNYSFIHKLSCERLALNPEDETCQMVDILNPLTEDQAVMRTSLIPGLLETMYRNIAWQVKSLKLFETGKIFISNGTDKLPRETEILAGLWTGTRYEMSWHSDRKEAACDFYDIKGVLEGLLRGLNVRDARFTQLPDEFCFYTRPGYTAQILAGPDNTNIGMIGELHTRVLDNFDLKQPAFIFELNLNLLKAFIPEKKQSQTIPKYPPTARDMTLIVRKDIESADILEQIRHSGEKLVEDAYLFDVFEGGVISKENKSLTFRIIYRSPNETLEDETVNTIHTHMADMILSKFDAALPA